MTSDIGVMRRIRGETVRTFRGELPPFKVTKENQAVIEEWRISMVARDSVENTRAVSIHAIALLADGLQKNLKAVNEKEFTAFTAALKSRSNIKESTAGLYISKAKMFLKWVYGDDVPPWVNKIKANYKSKGKSRADMLTAADVQAMIDHAVSSRDRALLAVLYESAFRRSELVSCRIKDLEIHPEGYATLQIPDSAPAAKSGRAKTGSYQAFLEQSLPYLQNYLNDHPGKDNPDAPLFISVKATSYGQPLEADGLYWAVKIAAQRAGIKKRVHPHLLRHSINTEWAKQGFSAAEINLRSGRSSASRAGEGYIHMVGSDVMNKVLTRRGFRKADEEQDNAKLSNKQCWKCNQPNPETNKFCFKCMAPLKGSERFEKINTALEVYDMIEKSGHDPEYLQKRIERVEADMKEFMSIVLRGDVREFSALSDKVRTHEKGSMISQSSETTTERPA